MKSKVYNILKKEWLETRATTIVFAFLGILIPVAAIVAGTFSRDFQWKAAEVVAFGGAVAVWLNATILCAISFARERETRTLETLKRACPDWRVAAAGKFGLIAITTVALAIFFAGAFLIADALDGWSYLGSLGRESFFDPNRTGTLIKIASLCFAFCWGVFWTGRTTRQAPAIFLTVVCSLACGIGSELIFNAWFNATESTSAIVYKTCAVVGLIAPIAVELVVLFLAPRKTRFGYLEPDNRAKEGAIDGETVVANADAEAWTRVGNERKPGGFRTLVEHVLVESALLLRSPKSVAIELLSVAAIAWFVALGFEQIADDFGSIVGVALIGIYYVCFASGLFIGSKSENSPLRERVNVSPRGYWLANALVAFGLAAVCALVAIIFVGFLEGNAFIDGKRIDWEGLGQATLAFGFLGLVLACVCLWSGSLRGGRLIAGARSLVVLVVAGLTVPVLERTVRRLDVLLEKEGRLQDVFFALFWNSHSPSDYLGYLFATILVVLSLWFAWASYRAIVRRMGAGAKPGVRVLFPLVALCALFLLAIPFPTGEDPRVEGIPNVARPSRPGYLWWSGNRPIRDQKEYAKRLAEWRAREASLRISSEKRLDRPGRLVPLSPERVKAETDVFMAGQALNAQIAEPFAYQNALKAEANLAIQESRKDVGERPVSNYYWSFYANNFEEMAGNAKSFALWGDLRKSPDSFEDVELIKRAREKNDAVWKLAVENVARTQLARDFYLDDALNARLPAKTRLYSNAPAPLPLSGLTTDEAQAYDALVLALRPRENWVGAAVVQRLFGAAERFANQADAKAKAASRGGLELDGVQFEEALPASFGDLEGYGLEDKWIDANDPKTTGKLGSSDYAHWRQTDLGYLRNCVYGTLNDARGQSRLRETLTTPLRPIPRVADKAALAPFVDVDGSELKTPDGRVAYRGEARRVEYASRKATLRANDEIAGEIADQTRERPRRTYFEIYPLFDAEGAPLLDENGAQYYGTDYWAVDAWGEPIAIVPDAVEPTRNYDARGSFSRPEFVDSKFDARGAVLATELSALPNPGVEKRTLTRVRASRLFDEYGENSFMVENLWALYEPGDSADAPAEPTLLYNEGDECSTYQRRRGIFADKRHIAKEGWDYAFDVPADMFENADKLRAYVVKEVGVYEEAPKDFFLVENGRVYSKVLAAGLLTPNSWILTPSFANYMDPKYEGNPVLIVEPLRWKELQ